MIEPEARRAGRASSPAALQRRFEAIVFDWDGTAVADRRADATRVRRLVEEACAVGLELAIVSGTHVDNVDGQLGARPRGPGALTLLLNRGSEVFRVDERGRQLVQRRTAAPAEDAALSRAAELTVERLAARGLTARVVSERLNRRKIDLIPDPAWADPPKARIDELLAAVEERLAGAGISGLLEAVAIARSAAAEAGIPDARVTSDAKHVEIGLTDKADSAWWIMQDLWRRGVSPEQVLVAGDELGPLGGLPGSDFNLLSGEARRATALSVGVEPGGLPEDVIALEGGPDAFAGVLEDQIDRRRRGEPPVPATDPAWTLTVDGVDPLLERVHESLLTLADGRLGTRGSVLVSDPADEPSVLLSGVYAGDGPETALLGAPLWNTVALGHDVELVPRRVLDLHTGTLAQRLVAHDVRVDALALSSLARPATAVLRVRSRGAVLGAPRGLQPPYGATPQTGCVDGCSWTRVTGRGGSVVGAVLDAVREEASHSPARDWVLDRVACYAGSGDRPADERPALARTRAAHELGFEALLTEHRQAWAARWEDADVAIDGDRTLQFAVRFALFHLMASVPDEGEAAVGARGLSGGAYRGHVFWDSDVYVLPFLAATHPAGARAMLEYRLRRLPAAQRAARAQGGAGARFPWESATSGEDVTPQSMSNPRGERVAVLTGALEEHIVADVAWATAQYIDWTGDRAFAAGPGFELLVQTARWWAARIELDGDGGAHIRAVIGPDEYHERVDDNAYTNVMARWTLRRAAGAAPPGALEEAERRRWLDLADALVDGYDPATGRYEQFAGFWGLEPLVIADIAAQRPVSADLLLGTARTHAAQVVKQPDVLMLHYLVPDEVAAGSLAPNLDFYDPRTAHGSTLSPGVHAALLARRGRLDQALELLRLTSRIDLDDIGQTSAGGLHLATMGSLWRALSFGFGGLRPAGGGLAIDPVAMPGIDALDLRVRFRGSRVRLRITSGEAQISASPPVSVVASGGDPVEVGPVPRTFDLSPATESEGPT
ncbi:MAG TPA: glycosyl hydrolase family 65 protein [Solirubrobacteraceae bacterium]